MLPIRAEEYRRTEANKVIVAGLDKGDGGGLNRGDGVGVPHKLIGCKSGGRTSLNTGFFDFSGPSKDGGPPSINVHMRGIHTSIDVLYIFFLGGTVH